MTGNRSFEQNLGAWLDSEAPHSPPAGLHKAVMTIAGTLRQRPAWLVDPVGAVLPGRLATRPRLRYGHLLLVLALVLALLAAAVLGASLLKVTPKPPGLNGAIAFAVNDLPSRPYLSLHLVQPDGTGDRAIGPGRCPSYSHDGSVMEYLDQGGALGLTPPALVRVTDNAGLSSRLLLNVSGVFPPALSPDGTLMAWLKVRGGEGEGIIVGRFPEARQRDLWVTPVAGGAGSRVAGMSLAPTEGFRAPVWSPDGKYIAFVGGSGQPQSTAWYRSSIYVVGSDGSNLRLLTSRPGVDLSVAWSPDGKYLAFAGIPDGQPAPSLDLSPEPSHVVSSAQDIFVIGADGTGEHAITATVDNELQPAWSPDGSRLAFLSSTPDAQAWRLATVLMDDASTTGIAAVAGQQPPADSLTFAWSPDAQRIVGVSGTQTRDGAPSAVTVWSIRGDLHGEVTTLLTMDLFGGPFDPCPPAWQRLEPQNDD